MLKRRKSGAKAIQKADVNNGDLDAVELNEAVKPKEALKPKKALKRKKW
jgi:hypothetical protein